MSIDIGILVIRSLFGVAIAAHGAQKGHRINQVSSGLVHMQVSK